MGLNTFLREWDERYDGDCHMVRSIVPSGHYHCGLEQGSTAHHTRESLIYAIALLRSREAFRRERAADVVSAVLALQDREAGSVTCGIWPMYLEEPLGVLRVPDHNYADFLGSQLLYILIAHGQVLPQSLHADLRTGVRFAADAIVRRNMGPHYTNIAFSSAAVTAAAGEQLDDVSLVEYARERFANLKRYTDEHGGFNEYNSPGYAAASMRWCEWVHQFIEDEAVRATCEKLRHLLWAAYADHYHPATGQLVGPQSRAYEDWLNGPLVAFLGERTGVEITYRGEGTPRGDGPEGFFGYVDPVPCPAEVVERFCRLPEPEFETRRRYIRRDTEEASVWGTSWFGGEACLGSVNHDCLWTQRRPVLGYWRTEDDQAVVLRVRFLRNGIDFASAHVCSAQQGNRVLSLFSLLTDTGTWHPSIDLPEVPGLFAAEDFRVRYQLLGRNVAGRGLGDGRFELAAGGHKAVVHTAVGQFGEYTVEWELGRESGGTDDTAMVEGVCYRGPEREFRFGELGDVVLASAVELLPADVSPFEAPVVVTKADDETAEATWGTDPRLCVRGHARAHHYR